MSFRKDHPAFARLPERLTITFPIWGLYDIEGRGAYADPDRMVREHVERGFNCIRLDDGAGLMHDLAGNPLGPVKMGNAFGEYDSMLRQFGAIGGEGKCDLLDRLIRLAEAAKKYGVYLILSSWYYLHTYWFLHDKALNDRLFAIPPMERFMTFARFLHYILLELEKRDLADCVAFAEVFNEADGLHFITGYGNQKGLSDEEIASFREKHEEAIEWLQKEHPGILFAYDTYTAWSDQRQIPGNMQVFNFHHYFLWGIYNNIEHCTDCLNGTLTAEEAGKSQEFRRPETNDRDWHHRIAVHSNINPEKLPDLEAYLEENLQKNYTRYRDQAFEGLANIMKIHTNYADIPVVCGEGVTYIGSKELLWEEHSETYWNLLEEVIRKYREAGLWGTVVRTCCGPEDPAWNLVPDKLLRINRAFLEG